MSNHTRGTHDRRSRLEEAPDAYRLALDVADQLDAADLDLWAAGVRACLDADGTTARQHHLVVELVRLSQMRMVVTSPAIGTITDALSRLRLGVGSIDVPEQPLYAAMRDLADHLELGGGQRWLQRLRVVVDDTDRAAPARLERLSAVLDAMRPEAPGVPDRTTERVDAVTARISRGIDADRAVWYLSAALRPPQPSRRRHGVDQASPEGDDAEGADSTQVGATQVEAAEPRHQTAR